MVKIEVMKVDEKKKKEIEIEEDDMREFKEVMNTLKETVPGIIRGIVDAIYSGNSAEEFGKQVANFYKSMIDAGMDKKEAYELTKEFMESRDISGIVKKILSQGNWGNWINSEEDEEEIAEKIKKRVKEEMKKEIEEEE